MEQIMIGTTGIATEWAEMRSLLDTCETANLVEKYTCLEILAESIQYEKARSGVRPLEYADSATVEHWEGHYLNLVSASVEELVRNSQSAGPVNMYGIRAQALRKLAPFANGSFELDGRCSLEYRADMESPSEDVFDASVSERQYHGE